MKFILNALPINRSFWIILLLAGCTVRLIAPYDEVTDIKVSNLQERIVTRFTQWERGVPEIEEVQQFYDESEAVLEILIMRNESIEKSEIIVEMLNKVWDNLKIVRNLHKDNQLTTEVIQQVKPDIMAQFNAIQKFQMALKRAEKN
jgi:hypothetical protein